MYKTINLNALKEEAYKTACKHGFHDTELSEEHFLMLVITELAEAVEADRKGKYFKGSYKFESECNKYFAIVEESKRFVCAFEKYVKDTVSDELADAVIRLLDLAGLRNIDVCIGIGRIEWYKTIKINKSFTERVFQIVNIPQNAKEIYGDDCIEETIIEMIISIFGLAAHLQIDIMWHIEQKMKYNKLRESMHGKKY